ncbi:unnamed protein product, partial [Staurois parvus]
CCLHVCYPPALISVGISSSFTITDVISPSSSSSSLTSTLILIRLSSCLMVVRDGGTFLCGVPGIQRTGTSLWWVPITGSIYLMVVRDGGTFLCGIPGIQRTGT